ncbi:PREDICTED: probable G-protein coupled receptor 158 [Nanorana parkeri]|uniref:probable G-protein coupled receptor 158 n=1 Tax=Nanorana parkeri TaxID=125878 RepID=UPI000854382F|nr:PREDICTED: probable G-protein coupled receptor 158 [Nanorana parkeri]
MERAALWIRTTESSSGGGAVPSLAEDLPKHVASFLYTGDSNELRRANCSKRYELSSLSGLSPKMTHQSLNSSVELLVHSTNFLNMMLQSNNSKEHPAHRDLEWYMALIRSVLEGEPGILRCSITVNVEPHSHVPQVFLQATRVEDKILLEDLSSSTHHLANASQETDWFHTFRHKQRPHHHKRSTNGAKTLEESWRKGTSYITDKSHVKWSAPFLECDQGKYKPNWLLTLSTAFYGLKPNLAREFRGVLKVDVNLQKIDIDQCSSDGWFSGTHRCQHNSSKCMPHKGHGFILGAYECTCKPGFYHPDIFSVNGFQRQRVDNHFSRGEISEEEYKCLPCREGCSYCTGDAPCYAQEDKYLRIAVISFQAFCMLLNFISMLVVYHFRRAKSVRASGLILLESILFGSLLLYFPVVILYFEPSIFRCMLLRWVRLLGYATVYGTVTLKLYRVLKVFLSRTAQRIPYMTSCRVMRMLSVILLLVVWFLVAWTSAVFQNMDRDIPIIVKGETSDHLLFNMCLIDRWDYMMAVGEFLFLLWGVYLCYAVRTVPSAFHEPRYMAVAVHNELIISAIFHTIRFVLGAKLQPDWMLMLFFVHTHLTVTVTVGLLLIPKFSHSHNIPRDDIAAEAYEDELDMGRSGSYLNSSITSAWSEHSLDPEDIRDELKKLYTQLEIYKRKKMIANNPHLQKKRCSKKGLGRSIMRRITEIPESVSRQCSKEDKEGGDHSSPKNNSSKKNHQDSHAHNAKLKEESTKHRGFSLKKSHSTYDHLRGQDDKPNGLSTEKVDVSENSIPNSVNGKKLSHREAEELEAVSAESVPLVCKSASAHNLTLDKKPLHPSLSVLQKSLSAIANSKDTNLGLGEKTKSLEDSEKYKKMDSNDKEGQRGMSCGDKEENIDQQLPKTSSPIEETQKSHKPGIMKQQAMSLSLGEADKAIGALGFKDKFDIEEVCPWEMYDLTPTAVPSENKVQKHVSIAPLDSEKNHTSRSKSKSHSRSKTTEQGHHQSKQKSPGKSDLNRRDSQEQALKDESYKKHHPGDGGITDQEALMKQISSSSQDKEHRKNIPIIEGILPPVDGHINSNNNLPQPLALRAEVCPWDFESQDGLNVKKGKSSPTSSGLSPSSPSGDIPTSPSKKRGLGMPAKNSATSSKKDEGLEKDKGRNKGHEKELDPKSSNVKMDKSKSAELCSALGDHMLAVPVNKGKSTSNQHGIDKCKLVEVCPWENLSTSQSEQDTEATDSKHNKTMQKSNMVDICPWDYHGNDDKEK